MEVLIPIALFAMVGWVVYVKSEAGRRQHQQMTELHGRILERMGSAREFGEFLGTEPGARVLRAISAEGNRPRLRILRQVQFGILLLSLGVGMLVLSVMTSQQAPAQAGRWTNGGVILTAMGLGSLLSAAISYRLLGHLAFEQEERVRGADPPAS